jgi:hypothetical protein
VVLLVGGHRREWAAVIEVGVKLVLVFVPPVIGRYHRVVVCPVRERERERESMREREREHERESMRRERERERERESVCERERERERAHRAASLCSCVVRTYIP